MSEKFEQLLARMPDVAAAVNSFTSETVQPLAFEALVRAFLGDADGGSSSESTTDKKNENSRDKTKPSRKPKRHKSGAIARESVEPVKGLDLRPPGKKSFPDFIAEKAPKSNQDKFAVAVYWLEQIAETSPITIAHLAAIFKQTQGWREPGNLRVGVTTTATRKHTLDTSDLKNLKTTPHGRNFVEHDLPESGKQTE